MNGKALAHSTRYQMRITSEENSKNCTGDNYRHWLVFLSFELSPANFYMSMRFQLIKTIVRMEQTKTVLAFHTSVETGLQPQLVLASLHSKHV